MFKITEKSHGQRLLSLVLAVILLFSFMQFNVQPAAAGIAGVDVAVVALRVSGNTVTTTLRLVQGTAPESIEISYYQNGKLLQPVPEMERPERGGGDGAFRPWYHRQPDGHHRRARRYQRFQ